MSEEQHRPYYFIDTGALAFGEFIVTDSSYQTVQAFETIDEAEAFVATANGTDVEAVRREITERARRLAEYRENLIRGSREKAARRRAENSGNEPRHEQGAQS